MGPLPAPDAEEVAVEEQLRAEQDAAAHAAHSAADLLMQSALQDACADDEIEM